MGDAQDRDIVEVQAVDQGHHLADHDRVERGGRLVEEQDLGIHRQRARDRHPLALPAGQRRRKGIALAGHVHAVELVQRPFLRLALRDLLQPAQRERDIVEHRHVAVEREILEHEADPAAQRADVDVRARDILAVEHDLARRRLDQPVEAAQHASTCRSPTAP